MYGFSVMYQFQVSGVRGGLHVIGGFDTGGDG
jgi:hypothetical protein